ncbi:hypothetical protein BDW62DRAFT_200555 [Aspergillus aurantiobrunneus]
MSQGVRYSGIIPTNLPGRGLGMVATRAIDEGEELVTVPSSSMLTIDSIPQPFLERFPKETSIHGILAAFLTHGGSEALAKWDAWRTTLPTLQAFRDRMPLLWLENPLSSKNLDYQHSGMFNVLPPAASGVWNSISKDPEAGDTDSVYQNILPKQQARLKRAWECTLRAFPDTDWDTFCHNWLIINTRSFYYVSPGTGDPEDWNDAVGLVPFADYFNHADDPSCFATFEEQAYHFKASRAIEEGEEVFISYGSHPNDFLFIEYGFFLDNNPSDAVFLDDIILAEFTPAEEEELKSHSLYGEYQVSAEGVCTRTEAVARLKSLGYEDWQEDIFDRPEKGGSQEKSMHIIRDWVTLYLNESQTVVQALENMLKETPSSSAPATAIGLLTGAKLSTVLERWAQIRQLCEAALRSINTA